MGQSWYHWSASCIQQCLTELHKGTHFHLQDVYYKFISIPVSHSKMEKKFTPKLPVRMHELKDTQTV